MKILTLLLLTLNLFLNITIGKHIYIPINTKKCFYENLNKEIILNGKFKADFLLPNNIKQDMGMKYDLGVELTVLETFDSDHMVYKQTYHFLADSKENRIYYDLDIDIDSINDVNTFTFTSLDNGEHTICIEPFIKNFNTRKLTKEGFNDEVKVYLDFERAPLSNVMEVITQHESKFLLASKMKIDDIIKRLKFIKVEQLLFIDKYLQFQDLSNKTNSRILTWAIAQTFFLGSICYLQLKFLKHFFRKQKVL